MSTKASVDRYLAALNGGDADTIAACVTEDFVNEHTSVLGHSRFGRAAYRAALPAFLGAFVGLCYDIEDVIVEDDRAAVAYRMSFGWVAADGTTRPVSVRGVFRFQVRNGLIAHRVDYWDSGDFNRQTAT